jgi:hypothetical protein
VGKTAAKRRIIVDFGLNVFEETGFEKRPPGLTDEERRAWGGRLVRENNAVITTDDGMFTLRVIGKLDVERR